jgi:hypothetical protein
MGKTQYMCSDIKACKSLIGYHDAKVSAALSPKSARQQTLVESTNYYSVKTCNKSLINWSKLLIQNYLLASTLYLLHLVLLA